MRALDLLKLFLTHAQSLAIVVDEFGGTEGIITLSDIVEEILSDAAPLRGDVDLYIEPLEDGHFWSAAMRAWTICKSISASNWKRKGSTRSAGWFSTGLGICPRPEPKSSCRDWR